LSGGGVETVALTDDAIAAALFLQKVRGADPAKQAAAIRHVKDFLSAPMIEKSCNSLKFRNRKTGKLENLYALPAAKAAELLEKFRDGSRYGVTEEDFTKFFPVIDVDTDGAAVRGPVVSPEGLCLVNTPEAIEELVNLETTAEAAEQLLSDLRVDTLHERMTADNLRGKTNSRMSNARVSQDRLQEIQKLDELRKYGAYQALLTPSSGTVGCDPRVEHSWGEANGDYTIGKPNQPDPARYVRPNKWEKESDSWKRGFEVDMDPRRDDGQGYCASANDARVVDQTHGGVPMYPGVREYMTQVHPQSEKYSTYRADSPDEVIQQAYQCAPLDSERDCSRSDMQRSPLGGQYIPADECRWRQDPRSLAEKKVCVPSMVEDQINELEARHQNDRKSVKAAVGQDALVNWYLNKLMPAERRAAQDAHKFIQEKSNSEREKDRHDLVKLRARFGNASPTVKNPQLAGLDLEDDGSLIRELLLNQRAGRLSGGGQNQRQQTQGLRGGGAFDDQAFAY